MPTIVYQGIQSCIEPQMVETRTLRLKPSPPNPELGCWNITQTYVNSPRTPPKIESSYVYPMTKSSSYSKLSNRSLELCTENLGCETGTNMTEDAFFSLLSGESNEGENNEIKKFMPPQCLDSRKKNYRDFPPPLTTMIGSNAMKVKPIRDGGRLVIQAVEAPSSHGCFQAERNNGRLRLSLFRDPEDYEFDLESESCGSDIEDIENEVNCEKEENVFEENMDEVEEYEEDEVKSEVFVNGDMERFSKEIEDNLKTTQIRKFQRPIWCKEGGRCSKGLCNWEPLWVATS